MGELSVTIRAKLMDKMNGRKGAAAKWLSDGDQVRLN